MPSFHVRPVDSLHGVDRALIGRPLEVFAIERFDRTGDGRVHQEDFAQALEFRPEQKYGEGPPGVSYESLARLIRDVCGAEAQAYFLARLAFVLASGNDDAHLKNWSFQWTCASHRPRLAPCYDLVATVSWPDFGWQQRGGPTLALAFGKEGQFSKIDSLRLRSFVTRARVENGEEIFMLALDAARAAWPSVVELAPPCMRDAMKEHWRNVPLLRSLGPLP